MLRTLSIRLVNFLSLLLIIAMLAFASYLQRVKGLEPCPLCMVQRLAFMGLGVLFFIGIVLPSLPIVVRMHNGLILLMGGLGLAAVLRQLWLMHFSHAIASCGADFFYMVQNLPFGDLLNAVLQGQGDCSKESWQILGLSLPSWSGLGFLFFMIIAIWQMVRVRTAFK